MTSNDPLRTFACNGMIAEGEALLRKLTADQKRNPRNWAMELVIVVAGVIIALWLQQWGERRQAQQNMAAAEEAIHDELLGTLESLIWREAIKQCHIDRIRPVKSADWDRNDWPGLKENTLWSVAPKGPFGTEVIIPSVYWRPIGHKRPIADVPSGTLISATALRPRF